MRFAGLFAVWAFALCSVIAVGDSGCSAAGQQRAQAILSATDIGLLINEQACKVAELADPALPNYVRLECTIAGVIEPVVLYVEKQRWAGYGVTTATTEAGKTD